VSILPNRDGTGPNGNNPSPRCPNPQRVPRRDGSGRRQSLGRGNGRGSGKGRSR